MIAHPERCGETTVPWTEKAPHLAAALAMVLLLVVATGCGPQERYGKGATGVWVLRPDGESKGVVLFLHGWGGFTPPVYAEWIDHLRAQGRTVVFPQYQEPPFLSPGTAFGALTQGVERAVDDAGLPTEGWVVAGHSAGGALAADYASAARQLGLPVPRAVVSVYPGRMIRGVPIGLPALPLGSVPKATEVIALAGDDDEVVGTREARRIARVTNGRFLLVEDDAQDDHQAPQRPRTYGWAVLDAVLNGSAPSQVPDAP